ncbi:MAG: ABC transporter permease [Deltaproteobacteria bacterium]|nr:ABC transporter permease [Deltaproteobacteria bacterium]
MHRSMALSISETLAVRTVRMMLIPLVRHRGAMIGLVFISIILFIAASASVIAPYDPLDMSAGGNLESPNGAHWFGTDHFGRDLLSRVIYGSRTTLLVGGVVVLFTSLIGTIVGLLAGYFKVLDNPLMRIMDSLMAFPSILLGVAIMAFLGSSLLNIIIALSVVYTPRTTRVVRSRVLKLREMPFIDAARALGSSNVRIIFVHVLVNSLAPLIVQSTFIFAYAILAEAALSFLGVGAPPEVQSWGSILNDGRPFLYQAPWYTIFPGLAIMFVVMGLNLLGDGLRDLLDPRLRGT